MFQHRFQNLIKLLIALQLLLPSGAPWLHTLIDGSCCASSGSSSGACCDNASHGHKHSCGSRTTHKHSHGAHSHEHPPAESHAGSNHSKSPNQHSDSDSHDQTPTDSEPEQPHDCSNCPICQAISAPRILALILQLPEADDQVECLCIAECADPLLGFGLPLQCRAPPAVA